MRRRRPGRDGWRRPGRPSSRWVRPGGHRRRRAARPSRRRSAPWRRCRPGRDGVSTPQWPWSVNSSRQTSDITRQSSPTSARTARIAAVRMPSGSSAPEPVASLCLGNAEQHHPGQTGIGGLDRGLADGVQGVLDHARHRADRSRLASGPRPRTAAGSTGAAPRVVSATIARIAGVLRSRRGRMSAPSSLTQPLSSACENSTMVEFSPSRPDTETEKSPSVEFSRHNSRAPLRSLAPAQDRRASGATVIADEEWASSARA